jgi:hypothetical protein
MSPRGNARRVALYEPQTVLLQSTAVASIDLVPLFRMMAVSPFFGSQCPVVYNSILEGEARAIQSTR